MAIMPGDRMTERELSTVQDAEHRIDNAIMLTTQLAGEVRVDLNGLNITPAVKSALTVMYNTPQGEKSAWHVQFIGEVAYTIILTVSC